MNLDTDNYINLLDDITLSSEDIKEQIKDISLFFDKFIDFDVENDNKLPPIIKYFYSYVIIHNKIPKQFDLWKEYKKDVYVTQVIKNTVKQEALKSRVFRAYPSLVRDIHFCVLLKERAKNCNVIYNSDLDYSMGIDILIQYKKELFGINLYIDTDRAKLYRSKKYDRHESILNLKSIDVPVKFKAENKFKDFYLYGENEIDLIKNKLLGN